MGIVTHLYDKKAPAKQCQHCYQLQHCLLSPHLLAQFNAIEQINYQGPFKRGQQVFRAGEKSQGLSIVHSGCLKAYTLNKNGEYQVMNFFLPGELLCIDDLHQNVYSYYVEALETSATCTITLAEILAHSACDTILLQNLLKKISQMMYREHQLKFVLTKMSAKQRLASFFVDIYQRMHQRQLADNCELTIAMTRSDIASYLGLATETVIRWMSHFQSDHIISLENRHIKILSVQRLNEMIRA